MEKSASGKYTITYHNEDNFHIGLPSGGEIEIFEPGNAEYLGKLVLSLLKKAHEINPSNPMAVPENMQKVIKASIELFMGELDSSSNPYLQDYKER